MTQPSFSTRGVVDLGALRAAPPTRPDGQVVTPPPTAGGFGPAGPGAPATGAGGAGYVVAVTEADFQATVLDASLTVPVVVDFWASWCGPCKTLSPILERLAEADAGRWLLATVDVDANPRLAGAFQVQSIPAVFAVIGGQPVPLFQGALPERQIRAYLDELLRVAAANGVTGRLGPAAGEPDGAPTGAAEPPAAAGPALPPGISAALDAVERGDLDGAAAAYRGVIADSPADPAARAGLAQVELLRRAERRDPAQARRDAEQRPDDVAAQCDAADADLLDGDAQAAFARLVEAVRRSAGPDRERLRRHLLGLFEVVGGDDPRVAKARTALASALF